MIWSTLSVLCHMIWSTLSVLCHMIWSTLTVLCHIIWSTLSVLCQLVSLKPCNCIAEGVAVSQNNNYRPNTKMYWTKWFCHPSPGAGPIRRSACAGVAGVGGLVLKVTIFEWGPAEKNRNGFPWRGVTKSFANKGAGRSSFERAQHFGRGQWLNMDWHDVRLLTW